MKKYILAQLIFLLLFTNLRGQNRIFSEDRIDEYTGKAILRTEWTILKIGAVHMYSARVNQEDSLLSLEIKILMNRFVFVEKNADLIIKFSDNTILNLKNKYHINASIGQGAIEIAGSKVLGINPKFNITKEQLKLLVQKEIVFLRLNLNDKYIETNIKTNNAKDFRSMCSQLYIRAFPS